jgi:hypothetical protein
MGWLMSSRTALEPAEPLARYDPNYVGQVLAAGPRPLEDVYQAEATGLVHGRLHGRSTDAGERRDLVVWEVTGAVMLHLAGDDSEDGSLAFSEMSPQRGLHRRRASKRAPPIARSLAIGRSRSLTRKKARNATAKRTERLHCHRTAMRFAIFDGVGEERRLVIAKDAFPILVPKGAPQISDLIGVDRGVDDIVEGSRSRREGIHH